MDIYIPNITGSLQLPLYAVDPATSSSGDVWFNTSGTGSIKYATPSGSFIVTRTLFN